MRIDSARVGFSLVMLVGGAGVVLGACASTAPDQPFVTSGTAASTGRMPSRVDGGTTCTADGAPSRRRSWAAGHSPRSRRRSHGSPRRCRRSPAGRCWRSPTGRRSRRAIRSAIRSTSSTRSGAPSAPRVALQAGDEPGRLAQDAAGLLHVVLRRGGGSHDRSDDADADRRDAHRATGGLHGAARDRLSEGQRPSTWPARAASWCRCPRRAGPRRGR